MSAKHNNEQRSIMKHIRKLDLQYWDIRNDLEAIRILRGILPVLYLESEEEDGETLKDLFEDGGWMDAADIVMGACDMLGARCFANLVYFLGYDSSGSERDFLVEMAEALDYQTLGKYALMRKSYGWPKPDPELCYPTGKQFDDAIEDLSFIAKAVKELSQASKKRRRKPQKEVSSKEIR